ncbi:MAG: hypothetical protein RL701_5963 [Pseudomonadota bacterium]
MAEETWRLLQCGHCAQQMRVCIECDQGQRYCSEACAQLQRRAAQRNASRTYQRTRRGAYLHALRAQRYRDRKRQDPVNFPTRKVTQQHRTQSSEAAIFSTRTPEADLRFYEERPAHGFISAPDAPSHDALRHDRDALFDDTRSSRTTTEGWLAAAVSPAEPVSRPSSSTGVYCTFCGRALPQLARLAALGRRTAYRKTSERAVRRRSPRTPTNKSSDVR